MIRATMRALLSHWIRHPGQFLTLLIGLSLATALWSGVQAINAEARASYAKAAETLGQNELSQLVRPGGPILQSEYIVLRRSGWLVSPVLEGPLEEGDHSVTLVGLDPLTAPRAAQPVNLGQGDDLAGFLTQGVGYAAPETAVKVAGDWTAGPIRPVAGLEGGRLYVDIGVAQRVLRRPGEISRLLLWPDQPRDLPPLASLVEGLEKVAPSARADVASLTDSFHLNLTAFGFLAFAVGLFIVHATIGLAFEQRRPMFRTLRALGVPARTLFWVLLAEVLSLALVAGLIGVALGYLVAASLLPDVAATLRGLYGAEVGNSLTLRPSWWAAGLAIAVLGAGLAAALSLWRIARLPVLAPAQPRAWMRSSERETIWLGFAALGLFAASGVSVTLFSGLIAGFAMMALLLLGSALGLPVVLAAVLNLGWRRARSPVSQWFWADTRQQLPGLTLALMALMLALAANIGVGTMVSSFRLTFAGWLDQRLASEFYVTARTEDEAGRLRAVLEQSADAVLPIWRVDARIAEQPGQIYAVADHKVYRDNWPLLRSAGSTWDAIAASQGVLINEQLWRRAGLEMGELLQLPGGPDLPIVGVYSDYGNPKAQVIIGTALFDDLYPRAPRLRFAVRIAPEKVGSLRAFLREDFGLPDDLMIDQASIKAFSLGVFERTFAVSGALNVLTLGIAGFAMLTSLMTLATMRLPQIAPIWALGLTRARLARLEFLRALLLAALTALIAIPVGLALAWSLLAILNVEAFGWRLPMFLFPLQWAVLGGLALLAAALAALWPVRRLAKIEPTELLKVFAHER